MSKKSAAIASGNPAFSGSSPTLYVDGKLYRLSPATNRLVADQVGYLDDLGPDETPMIPDIMFQDEFAARVSKAITDHNRTAQIPVVPDTVRMSGFSGVGIVDSNATYFVVRQDHSTQDNYSHDHAVQFRAIDYVPFYLEGGPSYGGIYNRVMSELQAIDVKK